MAKFHRFRSKAEQAEQQLAFEWLGRLDEAPLSQEARVLVLRDLYKRARLPGERLFGAFSMIDNDDIFRVWQAIDDLPAGFRRLDVRRVFDAMVVSLQPDTGRVLLSRDDLAAKARVTAQIVTDASAVLERMRVLRRQRSADGGVEYWLNPSVAWNGSLISRVEAVRKRGKDRLQLQLVKGGAP